MAKKIQPMRFSGRCEVIKAPTTENDTVRLARVSIDGPQAKKISARVRPLRRARIGVAAASARHTTHRPGKAGGSAPAHSRKDHPLHGERVLSMVSPRPAMELPLILNSCLVALKRP